MNCTILQGDALELLRTTTARKRTYLRDLPTLL